MHTHTYVRTFSLYYLSIYVLFLGRSLLELELKEKLEDTLDKITPPKIELPGQISPNESCVPPAITQFPSPLGLDKSARQHGGVIVHIVLAIYMFVGLAIVCDDFFVPALEKISEGW